MVIIIPNSQRAQDNKCMAKHVENCITVTRWQYCSLTGVNSDSCMFTRFIDLDKIDFITLNYDHMFELFLLNA